MRTVDQARLWYREGKSDKVYEVDLVEVAAGQYVVNFRFGRRGTALRDGTKTALPVSLEQARAIFSGLVAEKDSRGYQRLAPDAVTLAATDSAATDSAATGSATTTARTEQVLLDALRRGHRSTLPLHLVVRKVGDLGLTQAESHLLELLAASATKRGKDQRDAAFLHHLLVALARCGTARSIPHLRSIVEDRKVPRHLHDVALLALTMVGGAEQCHAASATVPKQLVPKTLSELEVCVQAAELMLARHPQQAHAALFSLYVSVPASSRAVATDARADCDASSDSGSVSDARSDAGVRSESDTDAELAQLARRVVLAVARVARLSGEELGLLRALNWAAELRRDGELFALLTRRFESQAAGARDPLNYFRRRPARTLRRMGSTGSADYVTMASELLLQYHEADAERVVRSEHGTWDAFARYNALNFVLYGNSNRYERAAYRRATWRCRDGYAPGGPPPSAREESYPTLWDEHPTALWRVGTSDASSIVIQFATRALREQTSYLAQTTDAALALALTCAQPAMRQLAFEVARVRAPNLVLARGALASELDEASEWVLGWVRSSPGLLGQQADLLALLITAKSSRVRTTAIGLASDLVIETTFARALVLASIALLMELTETALDEERADSASRFLLDRATQVLSSLGLEVLRDLLTHPSAGVARFGAELAFRRSDRGSLAQDLLETLLSSKHTDVRAMGARIVASTPPELIKNEPELLVHLALSDNAELRSGTRQLIATVARRYPEVGEMVASRLVDALLTRQPEGTPAHVISLLRAELRACLPKRTAAQVLALIGGLSPHARECGGLLLSQLGPDEFELDAIVRLANHEILSIRQGAWALARGATDRFRIAPIALARLCDARWQDSRTFAFEFVRSFEAEQLVPDTVIAICDSIEPLVQGFGLSLLHEHWRDEHAERYLLRLSEHPSNNVQLLVTGLLERYAQGNVALLERLLPCLATVLSRVNRGGVAKQRVLEYLRKEATASPEAARLVAPLLERQSLTLAVSHKGPIIATLVSLHEQYPEVPVPIVSHPVATQDRNRRGV